MSHGEANYGTTIPIESIKVMAESIGISNLPDDAAKEMSDDVTHRLKVILQDAIKFMVHGKRIKLLPEDIEYSMKLHYVERMCSSVPERTQFKFASGGGRELNYVEDKELDLDDIANEPLPPTPREPALFAHWLVIDGVQQLISGNVPVKKKTKSDVSSSKPKEIKPVGKVSSDKLVTGKKQKLRSVETVHVKQLATHELSVEQQLYYKEITETCVGCEEPRRTEALLSLSSDPSIHEMLPRMCTFIAEGVKVNTVQHNLALLIYLMRMVKSLLDNSTLYIDKYLHELIPSVMTCILSKQLCVRPEADNHWALRDFASRLLSQIYKNYNNDTNKLRDRIVAQFVRAITDETLAFSTFYGGIQGLAEMDQSLVIKHILPRVKTMAARLDSVLDHAAPRVEKISAGQAKQLLIKVLTPVLRMSRPQPDLLNTYCSEFGSLGPALYSPVTKAHGSPQYGYSPASSPGARSFLYQEPSPGSPGSSQGSSLSGSCRAAVRMIDGSGSKESFEVSTPTQSP